MDTSEANREESDKVESNEKSAAPIKQANNNHYVVPIGIIIVALTVLISFSGLKGFMAFKDEWQPVKANMQATVEATSVLERLLEHKDVCKDMQVFNYDFNDDDALGDEHEGMEDKQDNSKVHTIVRKNKKKSHANNKRSNSSNHKTNKHHAKAKRPSGKNGHQSRNRVKAKNGKQASPASASVQAAKKSNTAEPIIYLFVLVFLYLLLKAASEINEHYKTQTKAEKRLRRCSLQSYAQAHKHDRRASKGILTKNLTNF